MRQLQVTKRDQAIFRYVGQRGIANAEAIHQNFWASRKAQTCQDRLTQLTRAGYLYTATTDARGKTEQIYWIGHKAAQLFSAMERASFVEGAPAQAEIGHVLITGEVLEKLKHKYTVDSFTTERALKGEQKRGASSVLADGRVSLDGTEYLLEIDSPHYTGQRLRKKIADFGKSDKPTLWIVGSQARLDTVSQAAAAYPTIQVILESEL